MPQAQFPAQKIPPFKQLTLHRESTIASVSTGVSEVSSKDAEQDGRDDKDLEPSEEHPTAAMVRENAATSLIENLYDPGTTSSSAHRKAQADSDAPSKEKQNLAKKPRGQTEKKRDTENQEDPSEGSETFSDEARGDDAGHSRRVHDFNQRIAEQHQRNLELEDDLHGDDRSPPPDVAKSVTHTVSPRARKNPGAIQTAFDQIRPRRAPLETATASISSKTTGSPTGTPASKRQRVEDGTTRSQPSRSLGKDGDRLSAGERFFRGLRAYAAPGIQPIDHETDSTEHGDRISAFKYGDEDDESASDELSDVEDEDNDDLDSDPAHYQEDYDRAKAMEERDSQDVSTESTSESEEEYAGEAEKKAMEEAKVQRMILDAEEEASRRSSRTTMQSASNLKSGSTPKDATYALVQQIETSVERIEEQLTQLRRHLQGFAESSSPNKDAATPGQAQSAEDRLSLTVSKDDFARMRVIGQFNLGFILATRPAAAQGSHGKKAEELFIIDQHAADEKYNFERLQATTVVQSQRLVRPQLLDLTAIEEELILDHAGSDAALAKNGFVVAVDQSGAEAVGRRCRLVSLPMSREVMFDTRDLEELLALLAEGAPAPGPPRSSSAGGAAAAAAAACGVPRPGKVRRMLAMRACRSSIMIGRSLTARQMTAVVRHLGELDKPWNCPHGRPTMRHLYALDSWEAWAEERRRRPARPALPVDWAAYAESP